MKETSKVPVIASIELVVATVIGVFAFSESVTAVKILGILLVLLSILLFSRKSKVSE
jgi:DME family drug/metabolite transporter